ncbi:HepT-like ribonuclease domain-containing protein [Meiothermus cerbereus]|uniref:HepT-like ribonuclease domain-containing protein n=1 Tax=Meiothermus cerbereus TaxID=65552 RepID=UPI003EE84F0C
MRHANTPNPHLLMRVHLEQMQEAAQRILDYTAGMDFATFSADPRTQDAVRYNLHRMGVVAAALHKSEREALSELPWRSILDLPDLVTHLHFGIQDEILWDLVTRTLPYWLVVLEETLERTP